MQSNLLQSLFATKLLSQQVIGCQIIIIKQNIGLKDSFKKGNEQNDEENYTSDIGVSDNLVYMGYNFKR